MDKFEEMITMIINSKTGNQIYSSFNIMKAIPLPLFEHNIVKPSRPLNTGMVQNFLLIWLDENIDETNSGLCHNTFIRLREVVNTIKTFTNMDECINFIRDIKDEKIFMISSGTFGQKTVPIIHDMEQISTIYIFCQDKARHEQWTQQWAKVKGVFTYINHIGEALKTAVKECDQNTIPMSFLTASANTTNESLCQIDQSFIYTKILKEILLPINFKQEHIKDFTIYCREQLVGNTIELQNVDKFKNEYGHYSPIWWYTYPGFLYSMLNRALRTMETDLIIKLGFFICDLHEHIAQLHSEQFAGCTQADSFTVYRGQGLSQTNFNQLMKTRGGLMSFNNFLLTSLDRKVSLTSAESNQSNPDLKGVLFEITIDPSISSTPFANLQDVSYYETAKEILFSMHSIFRIGKIKPIDGNDRLWQVNLTLISNNDPQLLTLTDYIRKVILPHKRGWHRLSMLLIRLGQFDKAQQVCEIMLDQITNDDERASIYYMLGMIKDNKGEYAEAITFYEKSNEILQKIRSPTHSDLSMPYKSIDMDDYFKALSFIERAVEIEKCSLSINHSNLQQYNL